MTHRLAFAALLALAACQPPPVRNTANESAPVANQAATPAPVAVEQGENAAAAPDPQDLAGLSAGQRRAFERGFADCRAGRYDRDRGPEAYRLGCAAANDR